LIRALLAVAGSNPYFAKEYMDRYFGYTIVNVSFGPGLVTCERREGLEPDPEPEPEPAVIGRPALA
jgi:hypothetical protein